MKKIPLLIVCILIISTSCKKDSVPQKPYYLDQWIGEYEGVSHHWRSHPVDTIMQTWHYYKKVTVDVLKSNKDSSLNLNITYDDTIFSSNEDLMMSTSGIHYSWGGGGSMFGDLSVSFDSESISYDLFQKCGIPCSSGIDFKIKRK